MEVKFGMCWICAYICPEILNIGYNGSDNSKKIQAKVASRNDGSCHKNNKGSFSVEAGKGFELAARHSPAIRA